MVARPLGKNEGGGVSGASSAAAGRASSPATTTSPSGSAISCRTSSSTSGRWEKSLKRSIELVYYEEWVVYSDQWVSIQ